MPLYNKFFQLFKKVLSLYKGVAAPLLSLTILNSVSFGAYSQFKQMYYNIFNVNNNNKMINCDKTNSESKSSNLAHICAGGTTGFFIAFISTPFEFIKVQMQLDNLHLKRFSGQPYLFSYPSSHLI